MIVDLCRIEAGDSDAREEKIEQCGAGFRQLVQDQRAAGQFGQNCEQPGAARRLQHPIGRRDGGGCACGQAERNRRRELLERAAAELEGFVMKGTSGERERAEPPGALSRPDRLKPVPASLPLFTPPPSWRATTRYARRVREPQ